MKLNKLFLLAAMGLGLFACNNNDLVEGSAPNGTQEEGTTYVGFSLKFSNTNTRAEGDLATEEESHITSAYVMMASDDGATFAKVLSMSDTPTDEDVEGYYTTEGKFLFQTTAGNHDFYAVINPEIPPTENGNVTTYLNDEVVLSVDVIAANNNFMMSSCEKKTFYVSDNVTVDDAIDGFTDDAKSNNFTISVERVVAKVTMTCTNPELSDNTGGAAGGELETAEFYLCNKALKSSRMARTSPLNLSAGAENFVSDNTPTPVAMNISDKTDEEVTPVYCLENIHSTYLQDYTTYVILNTTFIPESVVKCDEADNNGGDDDFYTNPKDESKKSFRVVTEGTLSGAYILEADLNEYKKAHSDALPVGVDAVSGLYENGKCWFGPIWVGENNDDYAVERNYWYNLNITGITLPGSYEKPGITPGFPPNPPTNVAITLTVEDWTSADRNINLK